jgi:tRNA(fMet)-specific endonuclease VapC
MVLGEINWILRERRQAERNFAQQTVRQAYRQHFVAGARDGRAICSLIRQLKKAGTPIPDNNLWIAALALEHDLTLVTRDKHFQHIPQLLVA